MCYSVLHSYILFLQKAAYMSKHSTFVISLHSCFVFQYIALRLTPPLFHTRLNQNRPAGLRHGNARVHFNNQQLDGIMYKGGNAKVGT